MARRNQTGKSEFKITVQKRALLEADVLNLWRQLEDNKSTLIRPYSTAFSAILLPFFFYRILIKAKFFESLRFKLKKENLEFYFETRDNHNHFPHIGVVPGRRLITQFEDDLQKMAQGLPEPQHDNAVFILKYLGFPQANQENFVSILMTLPFRLEDLATDNSTNVTLHLMYFLAGIIDNMYEIIKRPDLHNRYHHVLSAIIELVPFSLAAEVQKFVPEFQGWRRPLNVTPGKTSCFRYAELIHIFFHQFIIGSVLVNRRAFPYVFQRLGIQFFGLSIGTAIFFNFIAIEPLLKNLIDNSLFNRLLQTKISKTLKIDFLVKFFLPLNWYLERPLTLKKYHFLETKNLLAEKDSLEQALNTQAPLVKRNNTVNKFLMLVFCLYSLTQFLSSEGSDSALAIIPILMGIILKNVITFSIEKYRSKQVFHQLNALEKNIKDIFAVVIPQCKIKKIKYRKIAISYVTLEVTGPHQNVPPRHVATVIKAVLNHYGVYLRTHDATSLAIDANTGFSDIKAAKVFFENALHRSREQYQMGAQSRIFEALTQTQYAPENVKKTKIVAKKIAKVPNAEIKLNDNPLPLVVESIDWGNGLRFPQNPQIKPLENIPHRFILWDLPESEFLDEKTYRIFKEHSTRFAYFGENNQGIKCGAYLGKNYHNHRRQEILPARIKVLGKLGMFGVLLSEKKSSNGVILYRTCDFTRVH